MKFVVVEIKNKYSLSRKLNRPDQQWARFKYTVELPDLNTCVQFTQVRETIEKITASMQRACFLISISSIYFELSRTSTIQAEILVP